MSKKTEAAELASLGEYIHDLTHDIKVEDAAEQLISEVAEHLDKSSHKQLLDTAIIILGINNPKVRAFLDLVQPQIILEPVPQEDWELESRRQLARFGE